MPALSRKAVSVIVLTLAAIVVAACTTAAEPSSSVAATEPAASTTPTEPPASESLDPGSSVSERERYRDSLLDPTFDVLAELPGFQSGGLAPDVDEIVVYWHGEFGPEAQAAAAEAESRGVPVNVIYVPYSLDELRAIAGQLMKALVAEGIQPEGYTIGDPFDEIVLWGDVFDRSPEARSTAEEIAAELFPADLSLTFIPSPGEIVPMDSRHNDGGQPTPGGAYRVGSTSGPACSSTLGWEGPGFRFYMQSAAHCVDYANNMSIFFEGNAYNAGTYSGFIATLVGNPNSEHNPDYHLDATLIGVPATPSIAGEMFTGGNFT
jgi:hypothetical protein